MNRKLKKYMAVGLSVFMIMTTVSANTKLLGTQNVSAAINSSIGSGLSWKLSNGNKTLTISGTGTMDDFRSASAVPWRGSASVITKVVFSDGLENIGDNAFAYCTSLKMISIPNTIKKIGKNAFYNSGLEMADFNMTKRVIDNSAFKNTKFYRNYFTTEASDNMNVGSAAKMIGRQVVVNVFINELTGVLPTKEAVKLSDNFDTSIYSVIMEGSYKFSKFKKSDMKYRFGSTFGSNVTTSSSFSGASATSLDDYKYFNTIGNNFNESSLGKYGEYKYVDSKEMRSVLSTVGKALSNLKSQSNSYGKNLEFITNEEDTNFYFTYNRWDDKIKTSFDYDNSPYTKGASDSIRKSYIEGNLPSVYKNNNFNVSENGLFGQFNKKMSRSIIVNPSNGKYTSDYTNYLRNKYNADGVVYLFHFNSGATNRLNGYAYMIKTNEDGRNFDLPDELCQIFDESEFTIMHEICHLYGAVDYYDTRNNKETVRSGDIFYNYTYAYYKKISSDIMMGSEESNDCTEIGADTAFTIGWSDNMLKDTHEVLLKLKKYSIGDVNMDGSINTADSILISNYNKYIYNLTPSVALTPMQKVLARINLAE